MTQELNISDVTSVALMQTISSTKVAALPMSNNRTETWRTLIVLVIFVPVAAIVAFVVFIATVSPLHQSPLDVPSVTQSTALPKWTNAVDQGRQLARAAVVQQNLPGLSVAVGVRGDIVWAEGFGWANLEKRVSVAPDMPFRIGHVSKTLTSAGVGLLREKGRLRLDDEIQTYVPAFPRKQWPITVRQLMGHVAGVRHYRDTEWGDKPSLKCERASEGLQSFANEPLLFEPETHYRYSTYGWVLVSAAVEAAANEPFFTFMRTQVFEPLGMAATTTDSATETIPNRVTSYSRTLERERTSNVDYSCFAGAGAFVSTPSDLVRFGIALTGGKFLQPATVRLLQTRQQLASGEETDYGLGWMVDTVELAGEQTRPGGPREPNDGGRVHVLPDISRTRDRRRGHGEHFLRGHEVGCARHRAGNSRGKSEASSIRKASSPPMQDKALLTSIEDTRAVASTKDSCCET